MSQRYPGGLIIKNPTAPTSSAAPGVWTLAQALQYIKAGTWPLPPPVDPYFNQTVLLLHGDGTDGAQNNTFLDSSTNNFTITRNGNTTQGTFSPFSNADGKWSNYFDGTGDFLQLADSTAWDLTGDYTIEMWLYKATGTSQTFFQLGTSSNILLYQNASDEIIFYSGSAIITASTAASLNTWNHVALVRNGGGTNNTVLYLNGVNVGQATNTTSFTGDASNGVRIGAEYPTGFAFNGYISNVSVLKTAKYTGAFTPSTAPLNPSETNQELLTCYSNRFVDANTATTAKTITVNGNTSVQPFSPFAPSAAYSPSVNGGSGYFDGTGDYLSIPDDAAWAFGSGDFTVEAWIYTTAGAGTSRGIVGQWQNSAASTSAWQLYITTGNDVRFLYGVGGTQITTVQTTSTVPLNTWTHIAVSKSSNDYAIWFNGVREATRTATETINDSAYDLRVGSNNSNDYFDGFISGVRVVKGSAVYNPANTTITIPTAPLTAVSGTELLCNFTNAGIFDNTGKNNLETVGNAQIDTTTKKYGTGSMEFDGTGDRLSSVPSQNSVFGTGDFTIECWVYVSSFPASATPIVSNWAGANPAWILRFSSGSGNVGLTDNSSSFLSSSSAISLSTWTHIAVARSGTSLKMFFDGVEVASTTNSTSLGNASTGIHVGAYYNTTYPLAGFVDDLRITKGVARYTTTFTPPTKAFPDL